MTAIVCTVLLALSFTATLAVEAQQQGTVPRMGMLTPASEASRTVKKLKRILFAVFTVSPLPAPHLAIHCPIGHTHSHEATTKAAGGMIYGLEATMSIYHRLC
jgi:hypothetical protein